MSLKNISTRLKLVLFTLLLSSFTLAVGLYSINGLSQVSALAGKM